MALASSVKVVLGSLAFAIFWVLAVFPAVPFLPIGRDAGSLLGAILMVVFRVLTPDQAYNAINLPIIGLLLGTMVVSVYLKKADMFKYLENLLSWKSKGPKDLLCRICLISAISSALFTIDTSCVVLTEFVLKIARQHNLPPEPFLLALASSANIGSSATPIGNPQNLVIAVQSKISFGSFLIGILPAMLVGVVVNALILLSMYWRLLSIQKDETDAAVDVVEEEDVDSHRFSPAMMGYSRLETINVQGSPNVHVNMGQVETIRNQLSSNKNEIHRVPCGTLDSARNSSASKELEDVVSSPKREDVVEEEDVDSHRFSPAMMGYSRLETINVQGSPNVHGNMGQVETIRNRLSSNENEIHRVPCGTLDSARNSRASKELEDVVSSPKREDVVEEEDVDSHRFSPAMMGYSRLETINVQGSPNVHVNMGQVETIRNQLSSNDNEIHRVPCGTLDSARNSSASKELEDVVSSPKREEIIPSKTVVRSMDRLRVALSIESSEGKEDLTVRRQRMFWKSCVYLITIGMLIALLMGLNMSWTTITAALALEVLDFTDARPCLEKVSYSLLIFSCGMFIAVDGFNETGIPSTLWDLIAPYAQIDHASGMAVHAIVVLLLSNLASTPSVPTVLLLGGQVATSAAGEKKAWLILAWVSTVAGNLSLLGSAAYLTVSEEARRASHLEHTLSLWSHLKFGLLSTLIVTAIGLILIR
ncbi:silicon efflux transporter LSI2-like [Corylus avellana]|uniref:silicon efflux transporter LSI2-like n=1 Tax=Corylus avellana TaxID=13451 RepID=UPI00286C170A|nr:silicon efflux transporter LSI2-like [Corylus avellana]